MSNFYYLKKAHEIALQMLKYFVTTNLFSDFIHFRSTIINASLLLRVNPVTSYLLT